MLPASVRNGAAGDELRQQWTDAIPFRLRERCEGLTSDWDMGKAEHQGRITHLMNQWIMAEKESQSEIEDRLRFFRFGDCDGKPAGADGKLQGSYLEAVLPVRQKESSKLTAEQESMRALCMQPATPVAKLRPRTKEEIAAIVMILNHEIEVPGIPPFLTQSMTPGELATFEDIFMALEYPIYAHLAPGQRFFDNLPRAALLAQIHGGPEAAPAEKQKIEAFKAALSRISLDMTTRVLKVSFKGRVSAANWIGWQVPFAAKPLRLIDYELIKTRAKQTHELVLLDYYEFMVTVRKGAVTSREMFWLLSEGMGLQVQAVAHTTSPTMEIQETQWSVRVRCADSLNEIKDKAYIVWGQVEVVIHHSGVYVNWPCRTCRSPDHPTRCCNTPDSEMEEVKARHTYTAEGSVEAVSAQTDRGAATDGQPQPMALLEAKLRTEGRQSKKRAKTAGAEREKPTKRAVSPARTEGVRQAERLVLPSGWEQVRKPERQGCPPLPVEGDDALVAPTEGVVTDSAESLNQVAPAEAEEKAMMPLQPTEEEAKSAVPGRLGLPEAEATDAPIEFGGGEGGVDMPGADDATADRINYAEAVMRTKQRQRADACRPGSPLRGRSPTRKGASGKGRLSRTPSPRRLPDAARAQDGTAHASPQADQADHGMDMAARAPPLFPETKRSRRVSHSPKRRAGKRWATGRAVDPAMDGEAVRPSSGLETKARSLSPKRRMTDRSNGDMKPTLQSFMHQFMVAVTGRSDQAITKLAAESVERDGLNSMEDDRAAGAALTEEGRDAVSPHRQPDAAHTEEVQLIDVLPPTDEGAPLAEWLKLLKGEVVDVAANGHCGWLAFFAALYNEADGLEQPHPKVVAKANLLKKRVLNEMIANLRDESRLHPNELRAEALALGGAAEAAWTDDERLGAIANHLAEQRAKSVKAYVAMHYWVRPTHLKAMAIHARETLYVLDVYENGNARVQAYAYQDMKDAKGEAVETGTVCPIPTKQAKALLEELVAAGIRPPVMILRWSPFGNHFQAIHYPQNEYSGYASNIAQLAPIRNAILAQHGWKELDPIEYDPAKTAKAAAAALLLIRKKLKEDRGLGCPDPRGQQGSRMDSQQAAQTETGGAGYAPEAAAAAPRDRLTSDDLDGTGSKEVARLPSPAETDNLAGMPDTGAGSSTPARQPETKGLTPGGTDAASKSGADATAVLTKSSPVERAEQSPQ